MPSHLNAVLAISLTIACTGAFAAGEILPAGTLKQGSLANQQLIRDAMVGVAGGRNVLLRQARRLRALRGRDAERRCRRPPVEGKMAGQGLWQTLSGGH